MYSLLTSRSNGGAALRLEEEEAVVTVDAAAPEVVSCF